MALEDSPDGDYIPVYTSYSPVYGHGEELQSAVSRYERLFSEFKKLYGQEPQLFARSPGRVNLIGEHIDYEGYSVLPMAIRQDTIVAVSRTDVAKDSAPGVLNVSNINSAKYPTVQYPSDPNQTLDLSNLQWSHYFVCGFKGVFDHMRARTIHCTRSFSLNVLIDGVVPTGAGLSSSAALVCASAIAVMASLGLQFRKDEIAEFTCRCERYIGTQSGGMDQAISIMGLPGVAKLIEFDPVRATDVKLPEGGTFVIANSLTVSNKAETASTNYNNRVVECRLAAMILAVKSGQVSAASAPDQISTLSDLADIWTEVDSLGMELQDGIQAVVEKYLHPEPYSVEEVEAIIGTPLQTVFEYSATSLAVLKEAQGFKLQQRAKHVYTEALRVTSFQSIASSVQSGEMSSLEGLQALGQLMNASHLSCSKLYECSCPELEELVGVALGSGALGSRLTGAGWGGCTVSLVKDDDVDSFILALKDKYFNSRVELGLLAEEELGTVVFASKPSSGAAIFRM